MPAQASSLHTGHPPAGRFFTLPVMTWPELQPRGLVRGSLSGSRHSWAGELSSSERLCLPLRRDISLGVIIA